MKVAKIIDRYTVAITTKGATHYPMCGDILLVGGEDIVDPETGYVIGQMPTARVKVTEVYEQFVVAVTYRIVGPEDPPFISVNVGDDVVEYPGNRQ